MTNEAKEIPITCTPQKLAQLVVKVDRGGGSLLVDAKGEPVAVTGQIVHTVRAWLVEQIEAGYHAGVEAGRAEAAPAPTDAAAESAAIDGLVDEAIRDQGRECNAYTRTGERFFYVGETDADVRPDKARAWLKGWLLAAWARGVAYGQQPDAPPALAESFGVASAEMPGCGQMCAAAREQVAAERAVDAATVAPSEDALAAAREEGRRIGWWEAVAAVAQAHDAEQRDVNRATAVAREMRRETDRAEDTRSRLALRAVATGNVLDAVTAAAPKEAP